jgi:hypothetical protein
MTYHFQDHCWPDEREDGEGTYEIRTGYDPGLRAISFIRLTGWKRTGGKVWLPIGPTMPIGLWRKLRPRFVRGVWRLGGKNFRKREVASLMRGVRFGQPAAVKAPVIVHDTSMAPGLNGPNAPTVARLRRCFKKYHKEPLPEVCSIPTADDFFRLVKKRNQARVYPFQSLNGWRLRGHSRIVIDTPERREVTASITHEDLRVVYRWQSGDRWGDIKGVVTRAWVTALWTLEYCLHVIDTRTDPLGLFPHYAGDRVTTQTLLLALCRGKQCAADLWTMKNRRPGVWDLI